ncbi:MAG: alpha/beta hydrolase [Verrucomicrobiota bacterium]
METSSFRSIAHGGCHLAYSVRGDGPPVVFIQGSGIHGEGWLPQVDKLAKRYQCLLFDNRGMGRSQPVGAGVTIEQMAEDVGVLMDAQGWKSAHVVGHSLGGLVAICFALSARERVRSLSLLCTFSRGADATQLSWKMFWLGLRSYIGTRRMRRRAFLNMVMPQGVLADADCEALTERLAPLFGHDLADHPPVVMKQLAAMRQYDATPQLHHLSDLPTLVVTAKHDLIAKPQFGKALSLGIRGARYVDFPDAAHGVCIQCADEINALLHEEFSKVEAGRARPI